MRHPTLLVSVIACLWTVATPVLADGRHHRPPSHYSHHHRHSPALAWGIAGLTAGALLYSWQSPPPVVVAPVISPPPKPPGPMWYYCDAYGAYYPYVSQCPGGWRTVPAY